MPAWCTGAAGGRTTVSHAPCAVAFTALVEAEAPEVGADMYTDTYPVRSDAVLLRLEQALCRGVSGGSIHHTFACSHRPMRCPRCPRPSHVLCTSCRLCDTHFLAPCVPCQRPTALPLPGFSIGQEVLVGNLGHKWVVKHNCMTPFQKPDCTTYGLFLGRNPSTNCGTLWVDPNATPVAPRGVHSVSSDSDESLCRMKRPRL